MAAQWAGRVCTVSLGKSTRGQEGGTASTLVRSKTCRESDLLWWQKSGLRPLPSPPSQQPLEASGRVSHFGGQLRPVAFLVDPRV